MNTVFGSTRQFRAQQGRALETRQKILDGAIKVIALRGVAGLTHRALAGVAGVSLAATTYHFATKSDIVVEASRFLLADYLQAYRRLEDRIAANGENQSVPPGELMERFIVNALTRDRTQSLAWWNLLLHGGRSSEGRLLAQDWFAQLDLIWSSIGERIGSWPGGMTARAAIERVVGLTFLLHPLDLEESEICDLLSGAADIEQVVAQSGGLAGDDRPAQEQADDRRMIAENRVINAAIELLIEEGPAQISYGSVAKRLGMVRSGPSYYFPTIEALLSAAQMTLFARAKERYRVGIATVSSHRNDIEHMLDVMTAIFSREAVEFAGENIAYYSVWIGAAQNAALRPVVKASLIDMHRGWRRRLDAIAGSSNASVIALQLQGAFIGKLVRLIAAGADIAGLSTARADFLAALR